tara:strand:+ start:407 stop:1825 length:1419 start_codon:yes stop_codon:yes gene_type:complete
MKNLKNLIDLDKHKNAMSILSTAGNLGKNENLKVYVVGGFVRDLLMEQPLNDIDLMVVGDGIGFARKLAKQLGQKKIVPFTKFGTAIIPNKKMNIEVATARSESYSENSRQPKEVIYTDLKGDLCRRDFTINAMAMNILPNQFGELTDPYNGMKDIRSKVLKTPLDPDETFSEDPLRMMRAAYFSSKLKFKLSQPLIHSMKKIAPRIEIVSAERIRDEFIKILKTEKPSIGIIILQKAGLLKHVFPEIDDMYGIDQTSEWHHKDIFSHTIQVVDNAAKLSNKMEIRFAALVHDIAKPRTRRIDKKKGYTFHGHDAVGERMINAVASRMKLPNVLKFYLKKLTLLHLRPIALVKDNVTDSAVRRLMVAAGDDLEDLMILCRADITTKNSKRVKKYLKNFERVEQKMSKVLEKDTIKSFQSPVRGKEIMKVCNMNEGPNVGKIKKRIEDAILNGDIQNTHQEALAYLMKIKENN